MPGLVARPTTHVAAAEVVVTALPSLHRRTRAVEVGVVVGRPVRAAAALRVAAAGAARGAFCSDRSFSSTVVHHRPAVRAMPADARLNPKAAVRKYSQARCLSSMHREWRTSIVFHTDE